MLIENPPLRWTLGLDGVYKALPTWGVYCTDHDRWVAQGPWSEREAYQAMCDLESTHPMRLEIRSFNALGPTQDEEWVDCPKCYGSGDCDCCGQECPTCDGTGEVGKDDVGYARAS